MSALQDVKKNQYQSMQYNEKHVTRRFMGFFTVCFRNVILFVQLYCICKIVVYNL